MWFVGECSHWQRLPSNLMALLMVRVAPRPSVEVGAALDVAMTVPALYFLLIVRGGVLPVPRAIPYFGLYAMASISTWMPGAAKPVTTVARAGLPAPKNSE